MWGFATFLSQQGYNYQLPFLSINVQIIFSINQLRTNELPSQFPKVPGNVIKCLVFSNPLSCTHWYSLHQTKEKQHLHSWEVELRDVWYLCLKDWKCQNSFWQIFFQVTNLLNNLCFLFQPYFAGLKTHFFLSFHARNPSSPSRHTQCHECTWFSLNGPTRYFHHFH